MRTKTPQQAERMLDAAARLFGNRWYHAVRMEDIAVEANVGKGTLYRYFSDKEELYLALLTRAAKRVDELLTAALQETKTARQKLELIVEAFIMFFDEQPHLGPLIQRAEVMRGAESPWQTARKSSAHAVCEVFAAAAKSDEFHVTAPDRAAQMLLGGVRSVVLFGPKPRENGLARAVVADFLDGVTRK